MKITIHNFGVITEAEFELKPLTIFVGPNNAGKTWVAYALASILGPYGFTKYSNAYVKGDVPKTYSDIDNAVGQVIENGAATIDLVQFATEYAERYFNDVSHYIQHCMADFMSTELESFEHLDISIKLLETLAVISKKVLNTTVQGNISGSQKKSLLTIRKDPGNRELYAYTSSQYVSSEDIFTSMEEQIERLIPSPIIEDFLTKTILEVLHRAIYQTVHILPTERTTFIAHPYKVSMRNVEESTVQNPTQPNQKIRNLSVPVSYFLAMMQATIENVPLEKRQRDNDAKNNPLIKKYIQLAQLLEEQILNGKVNYSQSNTDFSQTTSSPQQISSHEVLFQPTIDSKLEISIASSMVKELTPLLFYLRYLAQPGELIIIDEPEMNLHPEAQVKIIEFLAMLIDADLNVLITTHSPYVLDHLANLIKASEAENKENIRSEFYLKQTDAFISKDKVAVYLFEQGRAVKAMDEEGVIDLNTFGRISDRISEIYFNL